MNFCFYLIHLQGNCSLNHCSGHQMELHGQVWSMWCLVLAGGRRKWKGESCINVIIITLVSDMRTTDWWCLYIWYNKKRGYYICCEGEWCVVLQNSEGYSGDNVQCFAMDKSHQHYLLVFLDQMNLSLWQELEFICTFYYIFLEKLNTWVVMLGM